MRECVCPDDSPSREDLDLEKGKHPGGGGGDIAGQWFQRTLIVTSSRARWAWSSQNERPRCASVKPILG